MANNRPDIVTIRFHRNSRNTRIIDGVCVIGSAQPCRNLLSVGLRLLPAARCLLRNEFRLVYRAQGLWVFKRNR
ncbi:hypothetical protein SAMN02799630_01163 [Paenibacillus sp. UNCCL117]|uniref:hypothetical protein n=1 Tax=unclassified Paenibacillus TaxID=185978 RepID=UPI00088852E8|nr:MULTISPECIES: hypothetical protein [unclassified Paenibacillus]SDC68066.1 hypothetical protein SAMN04488602_103140 [Paenibacillus sp. cl123]SFW23507.1 hypothetical protein SAMN02799630_01163 [Paenibacillus sp. UNCCL117]